MSVGRTRIRRSLGRRLEQTMTLPVRDPKGQRAAEQAEADSSRTIARSAARSWRLGKRKGHLTTSVEEAAQNEVESPRVRIRRGIARLRQILLTQCVIIQNRPSRGQLLSMRSANTVMKISKKEGKAQRESITQQVLVAALMAALWVLTASCALLSTITASQTMTRP